MAMDFQSFLDLYECKACILSVELYRDGKYGNIRVVKGNQAHADEIQRRRGYAFTDGMPYETCFIKNLNFEYDCYRCVSKHQQIHVYVDVSEMNLWLEMSFLPLKSDREGIGYCLYTYNVTPKAEVGVMTDVAPEISSAVLSSCIKLHGTQDFEECISEVITDIREICGARRCCLLVVDEEAGSCYVLADSVRDGYVATRTRESMNTEFYHVVSTWKDTIGGSTCLIIKDDQDRETLRARNPEWYRSLQKVAVETLVLFPLRHNDKLIGYIWASNFNVGSTMKIKGVLELTTIFLASEIASYEMVKRLERLSMIDLLTGSLNRNAMNNKVAEFDSPDFQKPKSLGVVFTDLNGLKQKNDSEGHDAGDRLLKKAVAILRQVFLDEEIYRAGGDEFMIISMEKEEKDLADKIALLREHCDRDGDISFSIGYCFDDGEINLHRAMSIADARMYEDKERYYQRYPEKRYR